MRLATQGAADTVVTATLARAGAEAKLTAAGGERFMLGTFSPFDDVSVWRVSCPCTWLV